MDNELKQYLDNLNGRIDNLSERTAAEFRQMREENAQFREENAAAHAETRRVLRGEITAAHHESRLHVESTVDRIQPNLDLLAEGIRNIDEKLDREAADIRKEMRQGFADTHALIRFSQGPGTRRAKR